MQHVSANTETSASVPLMRASSSSSLLRAPLIFHVKIFIYVEEHPGRYRGIVVLPCRAAFGTRCLLVVRIVLGASFPTDHCSGNASIYKVLVISISFAIVEAERVPALYRLIPQMNQYLSCKLSHRFFDQHLQTVLSVEG